MIRTDRDIYELVKSFVPDGFNSYFNIEKNELRRSDGTVEILPNSVYIMIEQTEPPVRLQSGKTVINKRDIKIKVHTDIGDYEQIDSCIYAGKVIEQGLKGLVWESGIVDCVCVSNTQYQGLTNQGLPYCTLEYKLKYS